MKRKFRNVIMILLCIIMIIPNTSLVQASTPNDIANHWAKNYIREWLEKKLAKGYPDGDFGPDDLVSRAEFFTFVNRAFNLIEEKEINYNDVRADDWFYSEIRKAYRAGYIEVFGDIEIKPAQSITRQEAAVMLFEVLKLPLLEGQDFISNFKDSSSIALQYKDEINAVIGSNLMNGTPEGLFMPEKAITRAEAIVILSRAVQFMAKPVSLDKDGPYTFGTLKGNILISSTGVFLKDTVIDGDLLIDITPPGEDLVLENVKVLGKVMIMCSRKINIELVNCSMEELTVEKGSSTIRLITKGNTKVKNTILQSIASLEEMENSNSGFENVILGQSIPKEKEIFLYGNYEELIVMSTGVRLTLSRGTINRLTVLNDAEGNIINLNLGTRVNTLLLEAATNVYGKGIIEKAIIKANGVRIEQKPHIVELDEGITANIGFGIQNDASKTRSSSGGTGDNDEQDETRPPMPCKVGTIYMEIGDRKIVPVSVLAKYGNKVTEVVYGSAGILEVEALGINGLSITAVGLGVVDVTAAVENGDGKTKVNFKVQVSDSINSDDLIKISKIMDRLILTVKKPVGKQNIPTIALPVTDDLGYNSTIEWLAEDNILDDDLITISNGEAVVNRRGTKGGGGCGGHEETISAFTSSFVEIFCSDGGDEGGNTGPGGKKNFAYLVAVVSLGETQNSKEFQITIPWGWGREITVKENSGSKDEGENGGCDDGNNEENELTPNDGLEYELWLNQFPLILSASELAIGGKKVIEYEIADSQYNEQTVVEAVYEEEEEQIVECKIANDGRLWITPVGVGETTIRALVSNAKSEESCDKTVVSTLSCDDAGEEEYDEVETEIRINVTKANLEGLSNENLVDEVKNCLELLVISSGHGQKQTNKVNLPHTDYLGYETKITWETNDSEFISIESKKAIIHRRGSDSKGGGCDDHEKIVQTLAPDDIGILCGDDSGKSGCGGSEGGKINTAFLIATIKKGNESDVRVFEVIIPWGWGRKIIIE